MTINDRIPNFKEPQRRNQRHGRSRKSPAHSPVQVQPASDAQSGSAETSSGSQFNSAMITGGQFTAATNASHRQVTININATDGTAQPQIQSSHPRQATYRGRNRRTGPMAVPPGPIQRSNEIYERHLRLKKRGHPLWIPQSNMVLPIPYRAQGVRVGDVGIFTENGGFDFLFNICVPRDDLINPRMLPENFVPISPPVDPTDIRKFAEFSPGSYLASSSVAESRTTESSGLIFESSASEGAILTMPEGAYSEDLSNSSRLRQYIATHAEDWYKFVNGPRGREAQNGDLHVVVGCDKTTSWGMATFADSSLSQETNFRLKFSSLGEQESQRNAGNKYMWEHSGVAEVRVGPGRGENEELGETDSNRLRNQCLFLRTLNVTLSEKVWEEIFSLSVAVADQNPQDHAKCHHVTNTGRSHRQPSPSNSSQNLPSRSHNSTNSPTSNLTLNDVVSPNLMSPFGKLYSHDIVDGVPSMSLHEEMVDSGPSTDCFTDMFLQDVLESTSKMKCGTASQPSPKEVTSSQVSSNTSSSLGSYEEMQCDSPTPDVILTRSSSFNSVLHPSKIINQYLLKHVPHARVAVTHDKDWSSIIDVVSCHSDPSQLFSVVCSRNDIVLDNDTGLVYLELKEKNEIGVSEEEAKFAKIIESMRDGRLGLDQYLFGFHDDRRLRMQDLCNIITNMLRSGSTKQSIPMDSFLSAHPERPLSLDELLNIFKGSIPRQSITSLRSKLSLLPTRHGDRSGFLLHLGDALIRRFSEWAQKDDLEEAIWSYKEVLSLTPKSHYHYLEALLGLCSSLYHRYYLLGHADDLKNLLLYLNLQCDIFHRQRLLLAHVEVQLCPPSPILDVTPIARSRTFRFATDSTVIYPVLGQASLSYAYPVPSSYLLPRSALTDPGLLLGDYVGSISGLVPDVSDWKPGPSMALSGSEHPFAQVDQGSDLLHRRHFILPTLDVLDAAWTTETSQRNFESNDLAEITEKRFVLPVHSRMFPSRDVRDRTSFRLERDADDRSKDSDIANILYYPTEAYAGAYRARGIPKASRVTEITGIRKLSCLVKQRQQRYQFKVRKIPIPNIKHQLFSVDKFFTQPSLFTAFTRNTGDTYILKDSGVQLSYCNPTFNWSRYLPSNVPPDRPSKDGIPDRTQGNLLWRVAENIFINSSCHSDFGMGNLDPIKAPRSIHVGNVPSDLGKDIWSAYKSSELGTEVHSGFSRKGLRSHVLLAACHSQELAYERTSRGVFTVALLETLVDIGIDKLTYATLFDRMPPLSSRQNPECNGYFQERSTFNEKGSSIRTPNVYSKIHKSEGELDGVAVKSRVGTEEQARIHVADNGLNNLVKNRASTYRFIQQFKRDFAELDIVNGNRVKNIASSSTEIFIQPFKRDHTPEFGIALENGKDVSNIYDPDVTKNGLTRYMPNIYLNWHRTLQTGQRGLAKTEMTELEKDRESDDVPLYSALFCYDNSNWSIGPYYEVPIARSIDPPEDKGYLTKWVAKILSSLHTHSSFEKDRTLMLGSSNCSCQGNRSTYHMLLNHHHLSPLEVALLQLHHFQVPIEYRSATPPTPFDSNYGTVRLGGPVPKNYEPN